jgi:ABC-type polar amino acid transport system ATPase subunit
VLDNITVGPVRVLGQAADAARNNALELLRKVGLLQKADAYPDVCPAGSSSAWQSPAPSR